MFVALCFRRQDSSIIARLEDDLGATEELWKKVDGENVILRMENKRLKEENESLNGEVNALRAQLRG